MDKNIKTEGAEVCGLDLGDKYSQLCVLDEPGDVIEESRVMTTIKGLTRRFGSCVPMLVAMEVGTHSPWVSRLLEELGHEVIVANPRKVRLISANKRKSDKVDAELLARLARADPKLLSPIQHRGEKSQSALSVLRAREALVRARTGLINHVRGSCKATGRRLPKCSSQAFSNKAAASIPEHLIPALNPMLRMISRLTGEIRDHDKQIEAMGQRLYPESLRLSQVRGVGPVTSLAFVLVLEDPARFATSRSVGAYLGLVPAKDASGSHDPQLRISKEGDEFLRKLLVSSAQYILGPFGEDCDLRRYGQKIAARGDKIAKRRAVIAVARKLAVLLHALWRTGAEYDRNLNQDRRSQSAA